MQAKIDRLNRRMERIHEEIMRIRLDAMCVKPGLGDGMPHGSPDNNPLATYAARLDELDQKWRHCAYQRDRLVIRLRKCVHKKFTK